MPKDLLSPENRPQAGAFSETMMPVPDIGGTPTIAPEQGPEQGRDILSGGMPKQGAESLSDLTGRGNIAHPMLQGLTFGWGDEALAGVLAAYGTLMPESMGGLPDNLSLEDNYQGIRDTIRESGDLYAEENPGRAMAGEVAGSMLTGGTGLAKLGAKQGAKIGERLARGAGVGAAEGAIYGAGTAEEVEDIPEQAAIGAAIGAPLGAAGGEVIEAGRKYFSKRSGAKDEIIRKIQEGVDDADTALYRVVEDIKTGTPRLEADPIAKEAQKQGMDPGVIAAAKMGTRTDKNKMGQMAQIKKKGLTNSRYEMTNRPGDVVGGSLLDRFKVIKRVNKDAGSRIDEEAKKLKGQFVDFSPAVNNFINDLDGLGIKLVKENGRIQPDFRGSAVEDLTDVENMVRHLVNRMRKGTNLDAHDVHLMKKFIDNKVTYGQGGFGLKGNVKSIMKGLRHNLDGILDENFPGYKVVNDVYADTIDSLDEIQKLANMQITDVDGNPLVPIDDLKDINFNSKMAEKAVGRVLRRIMSNAQSRERVLQNVMDMDRLSKKYGGVHDDDILRQVLFADELDTMFRPSARTSLAGESRKAMKDVARTTRGGPSEIAVEAGAELLEKTRGINQENAFNSIFELLRQ